MKSKGISQIELAEKLGMNRVSISRLLSEDNNSTIGTLRKIADAIGCEVSDFFNDGSLEGLSAMIVCDGKIYRADSREELREITDKICGSRQ